jgi:hypothetical protein
MEKIIWLFHRVGQRSAANFADHYVNHHAVLGRQLCRMMDGYSVNIVKDIDGPNAVTEQWVKNVGDFFDVTKNFDTPEDRRKIFEDDRSLIDHSKTRVFVAREESVIDGKLTDAPMGTKSPDSKIVLFYPSIADARRHTVDARKVVDNHVDGELVMSEGGRVRMPSDTAVIRMAWGVESREMPEGLGALTVDEYRQIAPPAGP